MSVHETLSATSLRSFHPDLWVTVGFNPPDPSRSG